MPEKTTVHVDSRDWHLFSVDWKDDEGRSFSFHIYAICVGHAA
jgi:hypothetical protein